jgi:predicted permease
LQLYASLKCQVHKTPFYNVSIVISKCFCCQEHVPLQTRPAAAMNRKPRQNHSELYAPAVARLDNSLGALCLKQITERATWRTFDAQSRMDLAAVMAFASNVATTPESWASAGSAWLTCLLIPGQVYRHQGKTFRIIGGGGSRQGATLAWPMSPATFESRAGKATKETIWQYNLELVDLPWLTCLCNSFCIQHTNASARQPF